MKRLILATGGTLAAIWLLLSLGLLPSPLDRFAARLLGLACSFACPLTVLFLVVAPGFFRELADDWRHFWQRIRTRRQEIAELEHRIQLLDRAHHMVQLANIYARQGRCRKAIELYHRALAKEPDHLEAAYRLALCYYDTGQFEQAVELLEQVHAQKPDYDYGLAYLRLAQAHQRLGNTQRAAEIYEILLRFYPGHAEGSYHFAELLTEQGDTRRARQLLQEMLATARRSPPFQRRRNRGWLMKARWRLWTTKP